MSKRFSPAMQVLAATTLLLFAYTPPAYAYIDPTAAGIALQSLYVILGSLVMSMALIPQKLTEGFRWIKQKITGRASTDVKPTEPDQDQ